MAYFLDFHIRPTTITDLKIKHSSDSGIKTLSDCTLKNDYYYGDGFGWEWGNGTVTFESTGYITKSIDVLTDEEYDVTLVADPTYTPPSSEKPSKIYGWTQNGTTYYTSEEDPTTASKIYNDSGDVQSKTISARVSETYYAWTAVSATRAAQPVSKETYYTKSTTPAVGDNLYYAAGSVSSAKIVEVASDYSYIVTDLDEYYYNHMRDTSKDIISNYISIDGTNYTRDSSADITLNSEDPDPTPTPGGKMINVRLIQKTDTNANWATSALILLEGEIAYASDTGEIRIGDGKKTWNNLTTYVPKMGLNTLNDTIITNLATGNVLKYNGTAWVNESLSGATVPAGSIISYAGTTPPDGYLVCDGSAISRTTYAALFSVIGTTYGDGDGNSTFNLPDGTNRVLWGGGNGYLAEQLPNVKGYFSVFAVNTDVITDGQVFTQSRLTGRGESYQFQGAQPIYDFNAAGASPTYTDGGIVRPNSLQVQFCIKY
jgi:hypothetical protein